MRFIPSLLLASLVFASQLQAGEGVSSEKILDQLCMPNDEGILKGLQPVFVEKKRALTQAEAETSGPMIRELSMEHVGENRLLARIRFDEASRLDEAKCILYLDTDGNPETGRKDAAHKGADLMVITEGKKASITVCNEDLKKAPLPKAAIYWAGKDLYLTIQTSLPRMESYNMRAWVLCQRHGVNSSTPQEPSFALVAGKYAVDPEIGEPKGAYRFTNDVVKYESLENKGLTFSDVAKAVAFKRVRPVPAPPFNVQPRGSLKGKQGTVDLQQVRANLCEEAGTARANAHVTFGVPFPAKAIFDASHIRILDAQSKEVAAQITPTVRWPDDSLKWVLVDVLRPMSANESSDLTVEFGSKVTAAQPKAKISVQQNASEITVVTGPLKAIIDCKHFNVLRDIWVDGDGKGRFGDTQRVAAFSPDGVRLLDGQGNLFTTATLAPDKVTLEESGPGKVVVRVDGKYGDAAGKDFMRYVTRLTFLAGSPVVTVAHTHFDNYLATEFTELTSLTMPVRLAAAVSSVELTSGSDKALLNGPGLSLFQSDENHAQAILGKETHEAGRCPGAIALRNANGGAVTAAVHEFWQRWPKGITTEGQEVVFGLLPTQPSLQYGKDFPYRLMFPFVDGKYRMKWGMSFTERLSFDFSGKSSPAEMDAEANMPIVAVLPADWYATTRGLGEMAHPMGHQFAQWDEFMASSFQEHLQRRDQEREYGFLNYGDWFGERGRNWGNNEYDRAHGFFMQFARTGDRGYYRVALSAARHQADVDLVHDYPDPYYMGANHQHSIGHTGTWECPTIPPQATWSHKYDEHTDAQNGHTWSSGMCDAWCLAGDARVMDGALEEAEHIAWAMAPAFNHLGTHERSAGWSLKAIMSLYCATYDPAYLQAAKEIIAVSLKAENTSGTGNPLWSHVLPLDHSGGIPNIVGNNCFIMGIFLSGIKAYVAETGDRDALAALDAGTQWLVRSFDEDDGSWPYSATPDGKRVAGSRGFQLAGLNPLIVAPVAFMGVEHNDRHYIDIVENALQTLLRFSGPLGDGKALDQRMFFTPETLGLLQQYYLANDPANGATLLDGSDKDFAKILAKTADAKMQAVRSGDDKTFFVRLTAPEAELVIERRPVGSMPKRATTATAKVFNAKGESLLSETCSTDLPAKFHVNLQGKAGDVFKVQINDDQRGAWSATGAGLQSVMVTVPGFRIASIGAGRYSFFVPGGTKRFKVQIFGVHPGKFGATIFDADGKEVASRMGCNNTNAQLAGAPKAEGKKAPLEIIDIEPKADATGKVWSVVLWAGGDEGVELQDIPPYLALSAKDLFNPEK